MKELFKQKRWLAGCAVFLTIFAYLFIHVSYLFRPHPVIVGGYYAEPKNSLDMVYIGGSAVFSFWEPIEAYKQYGISSYNMAIGAIDPKTIKSVLKEALKTQSSSLILIDARPFQYGSAGTVNEIHLRNYSDAVRYSWERMRIVNQLVPSKIQPNGSTDKMSYLFDIIKYHTRWPELNKISWDYSDGIHKNNDMGFNFGLSATVDPTLQEVGCSQITEELPLAEGLDEIFGDLLDFCSKLDAQVLFVTNSYIEQPEHRMKYNYMKRIISGYDNISYINTNDYNQQIGLDFSTDFYDKSHVNIFGAEKYTSFLGRYIQENYALPDRRQGGLSGYWNEMIPTWSQKVSQTKEAVLGQLTDLGGMQTGV